MSSYRKERAGELLLSFLANEIRQLEDPAYGFVNLTAVDVSSDLRTAKVYWSLVSGLKSKAKADKEPEETAVPGTYFPDEAEIKETGKALKERVSFLRRRIGAELELRYVPELHFKYDASLATGYRIEYLLNKAGY